MRPTVATTLSPQLPPNAMTEPVALPVVADDAGLQELFINHIEVAGLAIRALVLRLTNDDGKDV